VGNFLENLLSLELN